MWGSVLIGISAVGAYVDPDGQMVSAPWANGGTFLGAVCFLVASILKLPEGRKPRLSSPHDWDLQAVSRARRSHPHPGPRRPRSALRASHV